MSKDLLVLADEYAAATATFARALALKDGADSMSPIARDAGDKRAALAEAIAALDTAQPVQVNATLVEALEAAEKLEHEALVALSEATYELKVGNTYTTATDTYKANNDLIHRLDKILNSQYRDRKRTALTAAQQAQPERAPLYSLDTDSQDIRARTVHAVLGALALGANNENKPPSGHWLTEIWDIARAEREGAVDRVTTLFENCETPYLPDIARAIDGAAHGIKQEGQHD